MTASKTTFLAIRHGQTQWNADQRFQGHGDSPLTPRGRTETQALARRLEHMPFNRLITSDLGRAMETAGIIAERTGHTLEVEMALRERNYGALEGRTVAEIRTEQPEIFNRLLTGDPDFVVPQGESRRQHFERNIAFFKSFVRNHPGTTAALVVHGGVLDSLFRFVTGMPLDQPPCFVTLNSSLSVITHGPFYFAERWVIQTWGDVGHLEQL